MHDAHAMKVVVMMVRLMVGHMHVMVNMSVMVHMRVMLPARAVAHA